MERALYNGILSGMSLEGDRFFYVNPWRFPLRWPASAKTTNMSCPPARAGLPAPAAAQSGQAVNLYSPLLYSRSSQGLHVHFFADSEVQFVVDQAPVTLRQRTEYPWSGQVRLELPWSRRLSSASMYACRAGAGRPGEGEWRAPGGSRSPPGQGVSSARKERGAARMG